MNNIASIILFYIATVMLISILLIIFQQRKEVTDPPINYVGSIVIGALLAIVPTGLYWKFLL